MTHVNGWTQKNSTFLVGIYICIHATPHLHSVEKEIYCLVSHTCPKSEELVGSAQNRKFLIQEAFDGVQEDFFVKLTQV